MLSTLSRTSLLVTSIGQYALEMLAVRRHLEVVAAFSQAIYLRTDRHELLWMTAPGSPMHRRCLQCSTPLPKVEQGYIIPLPGNPDAEAGGYRLDLQVAIRWDEPAFPVTGNLPLPDPGKRLLPVLQSLLEVEIPVGLGVLLPVFLERTGGEPPGTWINLPGSLSPVTRQNMEKILTCLDQKDFAGFQQAAVNLIGLGAGLTPSGDDFLGGLFFAFQFISQAFPGNMQENWNYSEIIHNGRNLTNEISFTLLQDHALGHSLKPMQELAAGLLAEHSRGELLPHARSLVTIGHSTGWDLLAGFSIGLLSAYGW